MPRQGKLPIHLQRIFLKKMQQFILGIQMRLVPELESITGPKTCKQKNLDLQAIQACFLAKLETYYEEIEQGATTRPKSTGPSSLVAPY